jgi:AcrR family transcriptional regulator
LVVLLLKKKMSDPSPSPHLRESSHQRILESAKKLFSSRGYEGTTTAMIAREAHSSESQLIKHFGGKEGLLKAIFEDGWQKLASMFVALDVVSDPKERLRLLLELFIRVFEQDPVLKELMLLEGRRIRKENHGIMTTEGYARFVRMVESVLGNIASSGGLRPGISPSIARSALVSMLEGMLREQVLASRHALPAAHLTPENIRHVFNVVFEAMLAPRSA